MTKKPNLIKIVLLFCSFAFLCSCQGRQSTQRWDENAYLDQALQGESISAEMLIPTPTDLPQTTPDPKHIYSSISNLCKLTDPNWSEDATYQEALEAYDNSICENTIAKLKEEYDDGIGTARFAVGYINEDDVPEVFICFDTRHYCGIHIFTWLPDTKEVAFVGTFSSYGEVSYDEKQNRITSMYGAGGYYYNYATRISEQGKPELIDVCLLDGTGRNDQSGILFYTGFPIPENVVGILDGSQQGFRKLNVEGIDYDFDITDEYLCTEETSGESESENQPSAPHRTVHYDDMVLVTLKLRGTTEL